MMNNKGNNIWICAVFCLSLFLLSGCDSFLDIVPTGQVIPETVGEFRQLLTSAYMNYPEDRGLASFRTDEFTMENASSDDKNAYYDIWRWNDMNADETTVSFNWRHYYNRIFIANHIIENESSMSGESTCEKDQLVGEAYMLRAYSHFLLLNLYARPYDPETASSVRGIPLKLDNKMDVVLTNNSIEAVYEQIVSDVKEALKRLNVERWENGFNYRFSTRSAHALLSRIALYHQDWTLSLAEAETVLNQQSDLCDLVISKELPNSFTSVENLLALEQVLTSSYSNALQPDNQFIARYQVGDMRKSRYFKAVTLTRYALQKGGSADFHCSVRTAELYLNAAESAARQNDTLTAKKYLYPLLEKRYNASGLNKRKVALYGLEGDALVNAILEERALELYGEGHRWFDLRRTSRPSLSRPDGASLSADDSRYTLPIPQEAVAANPGLTDGSDGLQ